MIPIALLAAASCIVVEGDRILMADLAKAIPAFSAAPGTEPVALAPAPRVRRTLMANEIERLAKASGIEVPAGAVACFEGASQMLTEARVLEALTKALDDPAASVTVVEFSRFPLPRGELAFDPPPQAGGTQALIWRGRLNYGVNRSVPVWARVKLSRPPREVERGDQVSVEVRSGAAVLKFEAAAESGGKQGEVVAVRNPLSGARFEARVEAKGKVTVDATQMVRSVVAGGRGQPGR